MVQLGDMLLCNDSELVAFPRSLKNIKEVDLLRSVYHHPQGNTHKETVHQLGWLFPEVEILQQNSDFAILRTCPGISLHAAHYIVGYADDLRFRSSGLKGLFMHNLPSGDIDFESEPFWYILQWLNRIDEGFHRVQGDLLLREIREGWEIEDFTLKEKEESPNSLFNQSCITLGNGHELSGRLTAVASDEGADPNQRAIAKTDKDRELHIRHREHDTTGRTSKAKKYYETGLQRRGRDTGSGGGD